MYSWEELKTLGFFIAAAMLGRLLFYRGLVLQGTFKDKVKLRMLRWLWELPVLIAIAMASFETVNYFNLRPSSGMLIAVVMGFMGLEAIKVWVDDYLSSKLESHHPERREEKHEHIDKD